jgi:hypothetical protein
MTRSRLLKILVIVAALILAASAYDRLLFNYWDGQTDLEIEFVVSESGKPVPQSRVAVHSEGGFYEEANQKGDFVLETDSSGIARTVCHRIMTSGAQSGLRITNTYVVSPPFWQAQASAPGYQPSKSVELDTPQFTQAIERVSPGRAKLVVQLAIEKRSNMPLD